MHACWVCWHAWYGSTCSGRGTGMAVTHRQFATGKQIHLMSWWLWCMSSFCFRKLLFLARRRRIDLPTTARELLDVARQPSLVYHWNYWIPCFLALGYEDLVRYGAAWPSCKIFRLGINLDKKRKSGDCDWSAEGMYHGRDEGDLFMAFSDSRESRPNLTVEEDEAVTAATIQSTLTLASQRQDEAAAAQAAGDSEESSFGVSVDSIFAGSESK